MVTIPARTKDRLISGIKKFQPIVSAAYDKDVNESDTVTIVSDILSEVFGYDKYAEVTSEYAVKKTYCDLAVKINGSPRLLLEVKAAGLGLKEQHIRQAVDYGANAGLEWVILTNGVFWKVYTIIFSKPVNAELVYEFDFRELSTKKQHDLEMLYYISRESVCKDNKSALNEYYLQQQLVNRYTVGQVILTEPVLNSIRNTIRKLSSDIKVSTEEIRKIIVEEMLKREILDDERASDAKKKVTKALSAPSKAKKTSPSDTPANE